MAVVLQTPLYVLDVYQQLIEKKNRLVVHAQRMKCRQDLSRTVNNRKVVKVKLKKNFFLIMNLKDEHVYYKYTHVYTVNQH